MGRLNMKYSVDRIEGDIVVLENLETRKIINEEISLFDFEVRDGNIVSFRDGKYYLEQKEEEEKRRCLRERLNKLKKVE